MKPPALRPLVAKSLPSQSKPPTRRHRRTLDSHHTIRTKQAGTDPSQPVRSKSFGSVLFCSNQLISTRKLSKLIQSIVTIRLPCTVSGQQSIDQSQPLYFYLRPPRSSVIQTEPHPDWTPTNRILPNRQQPTGTHI